MKRQATWTQSFQSCADVQNTHSNLCCSLQAESRARANFDARVALVHSMNSELPSGHQVSDLAAHGLEHLHARFQDHWFVSIGI